MATTTNLSEVKDLMVEASGIEAAFGHNAYSDYLTAHKRRPPPDIAATLGRMLGGRCRADDGKLYPPRPRRKVYKSYSKYCD